VRQDDSCVSSPILSCGRGIDNLNSSTTIIEHLQEILREPEIGLVYFYCDHRNHKKQLLSNFLSVVLVQMLKTQPSCIGEIEAAHTANKRKLTGERYMKIIKVVLAHFKRVLIVVDALDESLEEEAFAQAFADLLQTAADSDVVVQVILTSREDLNVERSIAAIATSRLSLVNQMEDDIRTYISFEVGERLRTRKMKLADAALAGEIVHSLVEHAGGMCVFSYSQTQCPEKADRRQLPSGKSAARLYFHADVGRCHQESSFQPSQWS